MVAQQAIINRLRQKELFLHSEYGVKRIGLFGSYAQGIADESSDVDMVVEFEKPIGFKFIELADYLEQLLDKKVDILTAAGIQNIRVGRAAKNIVESIVYV